MKKHFRHIIQSKIKAPISIAPLVSFRILFGGLMCLGALRFMYEGWIEKLYVEPKFFFKYYGFEWVQAPGETGMYLLLSSIAILSLFILLGLFYRFAIIGFFLSFTYLELIDATNYLNHYYLVILLAFLMIFLPANRAVSLDSFLFSKIKRTTIPSWCINILIFQIALVYTCAGIAKLNSDWLFQAMPLAVWLPEHQDIPILGYFFQFKATAYLFSWAGAFYDLTIAFFLLNNKTRKLAYLAVIVFHLMTWMLFNIGLFPWIMILSTLIFFPAKSHQNFWEFFNIKFRNGLDYFYKKSFINWLRPVLIAFIILQLVLPFRNLVYPGDLLWSEEGYRFSWRVMLVEKSGLATFKIKDPEQQRQTEIINGQYLTKFQEKQMSVQPDFILQFAHFLKKEYQQKHGINNPIITVDAHVALNGRSSKAFIDPTVNLAAIEDGFAPKDWILHH